jgi:hypothetical protein
MSTTPETVQPELPNFPIQETVEESTKAWKAHNELPHNEDPIFDEESTKMILSNHPELALT